MKRMALIVALAMLFLPLANAISVEWEPQHPKKNQTVKIYVDGINAGHDVKFEYCVGDRCSIPEEMKYEGGRWVANFTMPDAEEVELSIIVDGETVLTKNITAYKGNGTPGFELIAMAVSMLAIIAIRRKWN